MGLVYTSAINFNDEPIYAKLHYIIEVISACKEVIMCLKLPRVHVDSSESYISVLRNAGPVNIFNILLALTIRSYTLDHGWGFSQV